LAITSANRDRLNGSMTSVSSTISASPARSGAALRNSERRVATAQIGLFSPSAPPSRARNARCSSGAQRVSSSSAWSMTIRTSGLAVAAAAQLGQLAGQLDQSRRPATQHRDQLGRRAGLPVIGERAGQAAGQLRDRPLGGPQRRQRDPAPGPAGQPRQQAGAQQRRLAASGRADDGHEPARAVPQRRLQQLDQPGGLALPAEEHRRVGPVERGETGVRRPVRVPGEGLLRVQPRRAQPIDQPGEPGPGVGDVDPLHHVQQRHPDVRLQPHRDERPAQRAGQLISAKHHWDATDAALARKTIASARRSRV
jgi:hypothetical protein